MQLGSIKVNAFIIRNHNNSVDVLSSATNLSYDICSQS